MQKLVRLLGAARVEILRRLKSLATGCTPAPPMLAASYGAWRIDDAGDGAVAVGAVWLGGVAGSSGHQLEAPLLTSVKLR